MRILITNDDGIDSEGLMALKKALSQVGEVTVVAPDHNWSAAGHTKTMHKPLRVTKVTLPDGGDGYASDGTPSDCVALSMLGLAGEERPSLVVSGINKGANLGGDITYSGTVAAAMEAVVNGVPSIAVSLASYLEWNFEPAAEFAAELVTKVLQSGPPLAISCSTSTSPTSRGSKFSGVQVVRLGKRMYRDKLIDAEGPVRAKLLLDRRGRARRAVPTRGPTSGR